ncbi:hypothetical protein [Spirosoma rhododendri]|uniref:Uncharacterized protein n=1 Tax=Spirosoma rhododendri TaxID=2728024 RepID=A0A7L5DZC4_9BACT|nr:hypothetical protein [Spirosoma rhododendri]QJD80860.1 hypothetical protein HH216_22370 [Spirosoma rhododendri]
MTIDEFRASLTQAQPPAGVSPLLEALWYDANGDWEASHNIAQAREGEKNHDRLHAYLHRKEGDEWNAGYWYRRAKAPVFTGSLDDEWKALVTQWL